MYESVDDIDLYAGMLGEWAVEGGLVGPVTSCIMADQFKRLKDGDRFFYENGDMGHSFSPGKSFIMKSFYSGIYFMGKKGRLDFLWETYELRSKTFS